MPQTYASPSKKKVASIGAFLLASIAIVGYLGFRLAAGDNSNVRWPWLNEVLGYGTMAAAPVATVWLIWRLYRISNTVLGDYEVLEPSIGSPLRMRWSDVVEARLERENLKLRSETHQVVIAAGMYASPQDVIAFVASRIPCAVQGSNAA